MDNVPQRKVFTTVEANFLEAGAQMDLAAQAETNSTSDAAPAPSWWARLPGPSSWKRLVSLALGWGGAVALVATGVFVIGGAAFRGERVRAPATLAVVEMPPTAPSKVDARSRAHAIIGAPADLPAAEARADTRDAISGAELRAPRPAAAPHQRRLSKRRQR